MDKKAPETVQELLEQTRILLDNPDNWCKQYSALDSEGNKKHPRDTWAARWCLTGAMHAVSQKTDIKSPLYQYAIEIVSDTIGEKVGGSATGRMIRIQLFNDVFDVEHKDILHVLDKSIEVAKEKQV